MDGRGDNSTYKYCNFYHLLTLLAMLMKLTLMPTTARAMATMAVMASTRWIFFFLSLFLLSSLQCSFNASTFSRTLKMRVYFFEHVHITSHLRIALFVRQRVVGSRKALRLLFIKIFLPFEQSPPWKVCLSAADFLQSHFSHFFQPRFFQPHSGSPPSPGAGHPATPPPQYQSLSDGSALSLCTQPEEDEIQAKIFTKNGGHLCIGPMGGKEWSKQWFLLKQVLWELLHKPVNFHLSCLLHQVAANDDFCHIFCRGSDTLVTLVHVSSFLVIRYTESLPHSQNLCCPKNST